MDWVLAALLAALGGLVGGVIGVGGGILYVPALTIFFDFSQVRAESTSLLMIAIVAAVGAARQRRYGNVDLRSAMLISAFSVAGVGIGVVVANAVPERALALGFAALALYMALRLVRRAVRPPDPVAQPPAP